MAVVAYGQLHVDGRGDAVVERREHQVELTARIGGVAGVVDIVVGQVARIGHQAGTGLRKGAEVGAVGAARQPPALEVTAQVQRVTLLVGIPDSQVVGVQGGVADGEDGLLHVGPVDAVG